MVAHDVRDEYGRSVEKEKIVSEMILLENTMIYEMNTINYIYDT